MMTTLVDQELAETTGGVAWWIPIAGGAALVTILKDWGEFKEGFSEGWNAQH